MTPHHSRWVIASSRALIAAVGVLLLCALVACGGPASADRERLASSAGTEAPLAPATQPAAASFPAGTPVLTPAGPVPVETLIAGGEVISLDPGLGRQASETILELSSRFHSGPVVDITLSSGSTVSATAQHALWVVSGRRLGTRDGAPGNSRGPHGEGRWVPAADVRSGDELLALTGTIRVDRVTTREVALLVYDVRVSGLGAIAVGPGVMAGDASRDAAPAVLVHDEKEAESASGATRDVMPDAALGTRGGEMSEEAPGWVADEADDYGDAEAAPERSAPPRRSEAAAPSESGLSAGYSDDNLEFGAYLRFLEEYAGAAPHFPADVSERIVISVRDSGDRPVSNATVSVRSGSRELAVGTTYSDGRFLFFPSEHGAGRSYDVEIEYRGQTRVLQVARDGRRQHSVSLDGPRQQLQQVPLDVLFVLDTTGSMGEEIRRLTQSIEIIHLNLTSLSTNPLVRFGMVLYKDRGDEYVTRTIGLTPDVEAFREELQEVFASGGGDYPEDLQAALAAATRQVDWNPDGVRLVFVITDAPPQLYPDQEFTYMDAARSASTAGIRLYTVGTGGMDIQGEYPLRQISQYTGAKYIFLTYGERGESEGGRPGSVSHHTGANYETDKLEAIIIRFAREELQYLSDAPVELAEPYFQAEPVETGNRDTVLRELFSAAIGQLLAYSSWQIPEGSPLAVIPFHAPEAGLALQAEYLSEQLLLTMRRDETAREQFRLVERRDMQAILEEIEFQLSGLADESSVIRVGQFLGAELLLSGSLYTGEDGYELFLRLLRVETGEVLGVTKAVVDRRLVP